MTPATSAPEHRDLVAELAGRIDWRQAVAAHGRGEREVRELRIAVMRRRRFGDGATRSRQQPRGRP